MDPAEFSKLTEGWYPGITEAELDSLFRTKLLMLIQDFGEMGMHPDEIARNLEFMVKNRNPNAFLDKAVPPPDPETARQNLKGAQQTHRGRRWWAKR